MSGVPSVLAISGRKGSGSDWWRGIMPFAFMQRTGRVNVAWADNLEQSIGQETAVYDIIVLLRLLFPSSHDAKQYVKLCHRHGKTVIMDLDDDLLVHTSYIESALSADEVAELNVDVPRLRGTIQHVDGVTCTNAHLAARAQAATKKPVAIIPNLLDFQWWDLIQSAAVTRPVGDAVTIGWVGGRRNEMDVAEMAPAWGEIARLRPKVQFRLAGHQSELLMSHIPPDRVSTIPWTSVETYPLAYVGVDIGCCPLARSAFNLSKCVDATTRVTTDSGVVLALEIAPGMRVWHNGWRDVLAVEKGIPRPGIEITTKRGYTLRLSPEHRMMVNGAWTRAENISIGDVMSMEKEAIHPSIPLVSVPWPAEGRMSRRANADHWAFLSSSDGPRLEITPRWGRLFGAFVGDGSCGGKTAFQISCDGQDQDWIDLLMSDLRSFGLSAATEQITTWGGVPIRKRGIQWSSAHLMRVMEAMGLVEIKPNGGTRRVPCVPDAIWHSPKSVVAEFLAGYFEADGHCLMTGVAAVSKTETLIRDVQRLLLLFGITSRIISRKHTAQTGATGTYWHLEMGRAGADVFASEIGFRSMRKRARLAQIVDRPHSNAYRQMSWECEVASIKPCEIVPIDIQVDGEVFALAGFTSHNSPIKAVEFAASRTPVVASPTVYEHAMSGVDIARTTDDWVYALLNLVDDADERRERGAALRDEAYERWSLQENWLAFPRGWEQILQSRSTANASRVLTLDDL